MQDENVKEQGEITNSEILNLTGGVVSKFKFVSLQPL